MVALSVKNHDKSNNLHCHLVADAAAMANCLRYVPSLTPKGICQALLCFNLLSGAQKYAMKNAGKYATNMLKSFRNDTLNDLFAEH